MSADEIVQIDRLSDDQRELLARYLAGAEIPYELSATTVSVEADRADDLYSVLQIVGNARSPEQTDDEPDIAGGESNDVSSVVWSQAVLPGGAKIASLTRRMIAAAIDWVLVSAATLAADPRDVWLIVVGMAVYTVLATAAFGQTIGKFIMRIKVVAEAGMGVPGYRRAVIRWSVVSWGEIVGLLAESIPVGLEALMFVILVMTYAPIVWDRKAQGWHDRLAGTLVIAVK